MYNDSLRSTLFALFFSHHLPHVYLFLSHRHLGINRTPHRMLPNLAACLCLSKVQHVHALYNLCHCTLGMRCNLSKRRLLFCCAGVPDDRHPMHLHYILNEYAGPHCGAHPLSRLIGKSPLSTTEAQFRLAQLCYAQLLLCYMPDSRLAHIYCVFPLFPSLLNI